jgi:hypothetical protein
LPNVGKSTLFKVLTKISIDIANYPFCTIEPNKGVVQVPDDRIEKLADCFKSQKKIPAIIEFVDIAGLIKGASQGEGLGNQFLSHIRETQAIVHIVRCFINEKIIHVEKSVDPLRDIDILNSELILKDLDTVNKRLEHISKDVRRQDKKAMAEHDILKQLKNSLNQGKLASQFFNETPQTWEINFELQLLTSKPTIYLLNSDLSEAPAPLLEKIKNLGGSYLIMNIQEALDALDLSEDEKKEFGIKSNALSDLIRKAYEILGLITFLTTGADETRAWTIKRGMTAPQAGGVIHSDFEAKFIKAEVIQWNKLLEAGTYTEAISRGWVRTEGRNYIVQDGDVIEIKHN